MCDYYHQSRPSTLCSTMQSSSTLACFDLPSPVLHPASAPRDLLCPTHCHVLSTKTPWGCVPPQSCVTSIRPRRLQSSYRKRRVSSAPRPTSAFLPRKLARESNKFQAAQSHRPRHGKRSVKMTRRRESGLDMSNGRFSVFPSQCKSTGIAGSGATRTRVASAGPESAPDTQKPKRARTSKPKVKTGCVECK